MNRWWPYQPKQVRTGADAMFVGALQGCILGYTVVGLALLLWWLL